VKFRRLTRQPFLEWLQTADGAARLEAVRAGIRFRAFARTRARGRLWRPLETAARTAALRTALDEEARRFGGALEEVCYAQALPRAHVALRRLVLVPRTLAVARARTGLRTRLWNLPALADVDESVRAFFCEQLLIEMDRAVERAQPSVKRPVIAGDGWSCVGTERRYLWVDPLFAGAYGTGHFFMFEFPRTGLSRGQRKELEGAVKQLQQSIEYLSRVQRDALIRGAVDSLAPAR
jgi:hypothetical protein